MKTKDSVLDAINAELILRKGYLGNQEVETIYFGGGTPSVLSQAELSRIFDTIHSNFKVSNNPEITLEANPDDLTSAKIKELADISINRLSIGTQSFHEAELQWMNRAHNADEALRSIKESQDAGIENISIDLIYGVPISSNDLWKANLDIAFDLGVQHLSAYCLTVEEGTALDHFVQKGKVTPTPDSTAGEQFNIMLDAIERNGWEQYEISSFCRDGFYSRHNSNYWKGAHYLGIGPSAHSFDGKSREWNVRHNRKYVAQIEDGNLQAQREEIDIPTAYNEYVMTGLRTKWGCDLDVIQSRFGTKYRVLILKESAAYLANEHVMREGSSLKLTTKGKLLADRIASDLFA